MLQFDNQCKDIVVDQAIHWDATEEDATEKLTHYIDTYASSLRQKKLSEIFSSYEDKQSKAMEDAHIEAILIKGYRDGSWQSIREIFERVINTYASEFRTAVSSFDLDDSTVEQLLRRLRVYGTSLVEKKARKEARKVVTHMKDRFIRVLDMDENSLLRQWTANDDIQKITEDGHSQALKILSVMTVIRLEERPDNIEQVLFYGLMKQSTDESFTDGVSRDPLSERTWNGVSEADTIIKPIECLSLWETFGEQIGHKISQAIMSQEANKAKEKSEERAKEADERAKEAEAKAEARAKEAEERAEERLKEAEARAEERAKEAEQRAQEAEERAAKANDPGNIVSKGLQAVATLVALPFEATAALVGGDITIPGIDPGKAVHQLAAAVLPNIIPRP